MKKILVVLLVLISLLLIGCKRESMIRNSSIVGTEIPEDQRRYIEDEGVTESINEVYNIKNLEKYKIYRSEDIMNIDFYFTEDVTIADIMSSKDLATEMFVVQKNLPLGGPHADVVYSEDRWDQVNHRVYIDNHKVLEQNIYKEKYIITDKKYFEDVDVILQSRIMENEITDELSKVIRSKNFGNIKDIVYEKSFHGSVLLVKVDSKKELDPKAKVVIEGYVAGGFSSNLSEMSENTHNININYRGIVLLMYSDGKLYYQNTYHNGENSPYWFSGRWEDHNFYDFNE